MAGPLAGVGVGLFWIQQDGSYALVREAMTGRDGMYYIRGVYPGYYVLQVAGVNYQLTVGSMPMQDIPIVLR